MFIQSLIWGTLALLIFLPPNLGQSDSSDSNSIEEFSNLIEVDCLKLKMGQFRCTETIDPATQQLRECTKDNIAKVTCEAVDGLKCTETNTPTFYKYFPCKWTNGYKYDVALLLSVFLGFLGADRFYLGHVGMGALKCCSLGFFFIGHLVDIILIATQYTKPIDSSHYVVGFYGPSVEPILADNLTYIVKRGDWYI